MVKISNDSRNDKKFHFQGLNSPSRQIRKTARETTTNVQKLKCKTVQKKEMTSNIDHSNFILRCCRFRCRKKNVSNYLIWKISDKITTN